MNQTVPENKNQVTPSQGNQIPYGGESRHDQHQWIVRSVNELKDDNKNLNERIDRVYTHLSDTKNDSTMACAIARIESTMGGVERQLGKLDAIDTKLGEHSVQLTGLADINKKLERLDDIENSLSRAKWFIGALAVIIPACAGISWWLFGSYLTKILEALNGLVLK
ncbi:hypothetical protein ABW11_00830 [Pluralibacter gergoviae]|uniref:hypothetical protein n=1 Tax=Enterobacteriaceae TaxID=543 RepID=UPI0006503BF0|nr:MULTISPECIES: hypothetical protein [Enterobacteriaceae]KMK30131.1 hypothetical protein ABW11_00830 [Pluralibacter gergoviae]KZQ72670.1 hypothetical protein A3N56_14125 [Klebsiella aerogenes]HBZ4249769.1 hypothetical protein [Klebsiella aerogenes]